MRRILAVPLVIAGTLVPAIAASGAGAVEVPLTTTTTTATTEPGATATEDVTTTTTTEPGETATEELEAEEPAPLGALADPGALSISVPTAADLAVTPVGSGGLSGALGAVTVTDTRSGLVAGWTAYVSATDFVTGGGTRDDPRAGVAYRSGSATATEGDALFGPGQPDGMPGAPLDLPRMAFSALGGIGGTAATWVPTIVVSVPSSTVVGQYQGTITHSVA